MNQKINHKPGSILWQTKTRNSTLPTLGKTTTRGNNKHAIRSRRGTIGASNMTLNWDRKQGHQREPIESRE
ncbi:unnamed protein product [Brassica napus]|uniref:(rape) hypothetical protein n=1 Tax=Brassica napus TaxID=3708 RepID=A0A816KDC0_BRANA|nr:unnamed protein product [Brassica napus]